MTYIQTFSGRCVDLLNPDPSTISIHDIAHSLSSLVRFTGHAREPYTVAQHSICAVIEAKSRGLSTDIQRAALLHDAHEAYMGDISSPLKRLLPGTDAIEEALDLAISERFEVEFGSDELRAIDRDLLIYEAQTYLGELHGDGWPEADELSPMTKSLVAPCLSRDQIRGEFYAVCMNLWVR